MQLQVNDVTMQFAWTTNSNLGIVYLEHHFWSSNVGKWKPILECFIEINVPKQNFNYFYNISILFFQTTSQVLIVSTLSCALGLLLFICQYNDMVFFGSKWEPYVWLC